MAWEGVGYYQDPSTRIHPARAVSSSEKTPEDRSSCTSLELLEESQAGSREALEELLQRQLPGLRAFVRLRLGPGLRALESESDLVQSVCADLVGEIERFDYRGEAHLRQPG